MPKPNDMGEAQAQREKKAGKKKGGTIPIHCLERSRPSALHVYQVVHAAQTTAVSLLACMFFAAISLRNSLALSVRSGILDRTGNHYFLLRSGFSVI